MTKVLLVGNGAREHAIAEALKSAEVEIIAHMEKVNPGISRIAKEVNINTLMEPRKLPDLTGIDYAVIGPEAPLSIGMVDYLDDNGIESIGPHQQTARIETSKALARRVLEKHAKEANPRFEIVRSIDGLRKFEDKIGVENIVVKPDGLTGGKGVKIFGDHFSTRDELESYAISLLMNQGIVILEEKLIGTEFTIQAFCDGSTLQPMPLVRDYKRAYDGDEGPNTGSMGSYSRENHDLSYVTDSDFSNAMDIMQRTILGLKKQTRKEYRGILYGQFIKTERGIKVIEFNARFGDPEAMNVLSILSSSIDEVFQSMIDGNLIKPKFENLATVCVYIVPEGYPGPDVVSDMPLSIVPGIQSELYYASVYEKDGTIHTTGSRSIGILGKGASVNAAREMAYSDVDKVNGKVRFRTDIAQEII